MATILHIRPQPPDRCLAALVGVIVGTWAILPPYIGPRLNAAARAEVVDHAVPGAAVIVVSLAALGLGRRRTGGTIMFGAGLVVTLAGLWTTATHLPLLAQATRHEAPILAVVHHSLPGLFVLGLGVTWVVRHWSDAER